jgi:uncharacterized Tic20 family protein
MNAMETTPASSDERVMGALAHFFGFIAALLIWATQKDKSRFVRFQALQALAFDAVLTVASMVLSICMVGLIFAGMLAVAISAAQAPSSPNSFLPISMASTVFPMSMLACFMPFTLAALLIRTIAAVSVASGRDFRYPVIAKWVDGFLGGAPGREIGRG